MPSLVCQPGWASTWASRLLHTASIALLALPPSAKAQSPSKATLAAASAAMQKGVAAAKSNDLPAAAQAFSHAVQLMPMIAAAHAALGSVELAQGDLTAAARELQQAHRLDPADPETTLNLARTRSLQGDYSSALPLFREALAGDTAPVLSADESLAYATSLSAAGDDTEAADRLRAALQRTPNSAVLHDGLGTVLAKSGYIDQAQPEFERATLLEPTLAQAQLHFGTSELLLGRPEHAISPLRLAATGMPQSFEAHLQFGRALSASHQDREALVELHRAAELRIVTTPLASTYALALALEASGDSAGSLPLFAVATVTPELGSAALVNYALAHVQTGDAIGALPLYAKAVALGPDSPTLREDYGVAYLQQSDLDHAIVQFRAGLALDPQSAHLHHDLGLAYKLKDDLAQSISELQRASELDPTLPDPAYTLGVIYMQQGRYPEAITELRRATTLQPNNGEAWALLGGVLKDSDNTAAAIDALRHASELEPEQPSLHVQLAALFVRSGDSSQAVAERKIAADLSRAAVSEQRASFALRSGRALLAQGKLPEAIVQLNAASTADPKLAEPHTLLADALTRQGKAAEAALERQRAAALRTP